MNFSKSMVAKIVRRARVMCVKCYTKARLDHEKGEAVNRPSSDVMSESAVRWLTPEERQELRSDMAEASAWARAELRKRRAAKNSKISSRGIVNGISVWSDNN